MSWRCGYWSGCCTIHEPLSHPILASKHLTTNSSPNHRTKCAPPITTRGGGTTRPGAYMSPNSQVPPSRYTPARHRAFRASLSPNTVSPPTGSSASSLQRPSAWRPPRRRHTEDYFQQRPAVGTPGSARRPGTSLLNPASRNDRHVQTSPGRWRRQRDGSPGYAQSHVIVAA